MPIMTSRYKNLSDALNQATLDWKIAKAVKSDAARVTRELSEKGCATVHVDGRDFLIRQKSKEPAARVSGRRS